MGNKYNINSFLKVQFYMIVVIVLFLVSCNPGKNQQQYYLPAEFEENASVCFIWTETFDEIIPKLIGVISEKDKVTIFADEKRDSIKIITRVLKKYNARFENIHYVKVKNIPEHVWVRDFGPVFLVNKAGGKKMVDFSYFGTNLGFSRSLASMMNVPVIYSKLNSTGGSRDVNGKGTILLCEAHELDVNKPRSKIEIEAEIKEKLKQTKVIWLKKGIPQDDSILDGPIAGNVYPKGVNGHIDEFCRFASHNTILISSVSENEAQQNPILAEAKKRLDENYKILVNSTAQDGGRFNVIKVPFAPLRIYKRKFNSEIKLVTSVTSYMNFIITNSAIVMPSYISEKPGKGIVEKEKEVEQIFTDVFPGREIIKVRADLINYFSGGFHCASINEPGMKNEDTIFDFGEPLGNKQD